MLLLAAGLALVHVNGRSGPRTMRVAGPAETAGTAASADAGSASASAPSASASAPTGSGAGTAAGPTATGGPPVGPPTTRPRPAPAAAASPAASPPSSLPPSPFPPPPDAPAAPDLPPASTWSGQGNGVTLRVTMDPAAPKPGQSVRYSVTTTSANACCAVLLDFGDGSGTTQPDAGAACPGAGALPATRTSVATHVFGAAGVYSLSVRVAALPDGICSGAPGPATGQGYSLYGCVAVGQVPAGKGCRWGAA